MPDSRWTNGATRFGQIELRVDDRQLLVRGRPVALGSRAFDLLVALARRPGQLVSKSDLLSVVWPDLVVEEGNIAVQVNALRKVVGAGVIATVPGRGYRLVVPPAASATEDAAPPPPRSTLPRLLPEIFGRGQELASLGSLVEGGPLVSVVGAGGVGKTLLVQHLAHARRTVHAHGVGWIELAGLTNPDALPATIASALGLRLGAGDAIEALAAALSSKHVLLVLDNVEHLTRVVGDLAVRLANAAPGIRIVVTSQARLGVPIETVMRLRPLDLPPAGADVMQALSFSAVALFVDRVQASNPRFTLSESNVQAVTAVCRALDGLPLALELAAARVHLLGIERLAGSMKDRLLLLTKNPNQTAPARQQTLRATLEWSHGLLTAAERAALRRLAVVAGSSSLELACCVSQGNEGHGPADEWSLLDALDTLVDHSFIALLATPDEAAPRYRLLESTKTFAFEMLLAAGEVDATRMRHASGVATLLEEAWAKYFGSAARIDDLRRLLAPDLDNARAALGWVDCPPSVRLTIASHLLRVLPHSLVVERRSLADAVESLLDLEPSLDRRVFGWLTIALAFFNTNRRRSGIAVRHAVSLAREQVRVSGERRYLCHALGVLASLQTLNREPGPARRSLDEMRTIEREERIVPAFLWRAEAEMELALLEGNKAEHLRLTREKLLRTTDPQDRLIGTANLASAQLAVGDAHASLATAGELLSTLGANGVEPQLSMARITLFAALLAIDRHRDAREVAQAGWPHAVQYDVQSSWGDHLALLAALENRPFAAARLCGYASAAHERFGGQREFNAQQAFDRAFKSISASLNADEVARLLKEGRALTDHDVSSLAFSTVG